MPRSVAVLLVLLIFPSFASAQEIDMGKQGTHAVVEGETLWTLAELYLGDPYRWPLIYEANRDRIREAHWIFPHQLLVIPGVEIEPVEPQPPVEPVEVEPVEVEPVEVEPVEPVEVVVIPVPEPEVRPVAVPLDLPPCPSATGRTIFYQGTGDADRGCVMAVPSPEDRTAFFDDPTVVIGAISGSGGADLYAVPRGLVYSVPWLREWAEELAFLGTVVGFAQVDGERVNKSRANLLEKVQIDLEEGVHFNVGDLLQSFTLGRAAEGLGQVVRPTGILVVTSVQDAGVVATVSARFEWLDLGQRVRLTPSFNLTRGREAQDVESNLRATVLGFNVDLVLHGFGAIAFLDVGEDQGVKIGDEFMAYVNQEDGWDGEEAVRLQVVLVDGPVASARVITVNEPNLKPGAEVLLVRKMR